VVTATDLARRPRSEVEAWLGTLSQLEVEALAYDWDFWARPNQRLPDGGWLTWLLMGGRGMGKSRTGAETVRKWSSRARGISRWWARRPRKCAMS